jgi:hypothetical protein
MMVAYVHNSIGEGRSMGAVAEGWMDCTVTSLLRVITVE